MRRAAIFITKCMIGLLVAVSCSAAMALGYARVQGLLLLSVQTGSMEPAIRPGDGILLRQGIGGLSAGDIISYRSLDNSKLVITHRVVAIDASTGAITTKGDALQTADRPFGADRVIGKVDRTLPLAGYVLSFMRHPVGLAAAVYVPAIALAYGEIRRLMRHYESQRYRLHAYLY